MNKTFALICYHLGAWGFLGFLVTIILGIIAFYTNLSQNIFYGILIGFAAISVSITANCVYRECKK
jgi:TctA family transporter